jgi:hypothetical protein
VLLEWLEGLSGGLGGLDCSGGRPLICSALTSSSEVLRETGGVPFCETQRKLHHGFVIDELYKRLASSHSLSSAAVEACAKSQRLLKICGGSHQAMAAVQRKAAQGQTLYLGLRV